MSKHQRCDVMVVGAGVSAALTALAVIRQKASRGRAKRNVCLLRMGEESADVAAAGYAFLNPRAVTHIPGLKARIPRLTDGSFKGLQVVGARDGRRGEFLSRSICGYAVDGPKLLKALLTQCRSDRVKVIDAPADARLDIAGESVTASWSGGQVDSEVTMLADLAALEAAEQLGFRHHWLSRLYRCYGITFDATAARIRKAFGTSPRMTTVWQLESLGNDGETSTSPSGQDGHAWIIPRKSSVSVGLLLARQARPDRKVALAEGEEVMGRVLRDLRALGVLPDEFDKQVGSLSTWRLPLAAALDIESHIGKRTLALGLAGGFVSALSGQWLYPTVHAAALAAGVVDKALADDRPQDQLGQFGVRWRQKLSDYLRSPNTRLTFLLPLAFSNQQIMDRFCRAYLFGENF